MRVQVKLFAILRERAGCAQTSLDLPTNASVDVASAALARQFPPIADHLARVAFAVNQSYVDRSTVLHDGDELAIIPPVSGG